MLFVNLVISNSNMYSLNDKFLEGVKEPLFWCQREEHYHIYIEIRLTILKCANNPSFDQLLAICQPSISQESSQVLKGRFDPMSNEQDLI